MKHGSRQRHIESLNRKIADLERQLADAKSLGKRLERTAFALFDWYASQVDGLVIVSGEVVQVIQAKAMWEGQKDG